MGKTKVAVFRSYFSKSRAAVVAILLMIAIYVVGYTAGTSYANDSSRLILLGATAANTKAVSHANQNESTTKVGVEDTTQNNPASKDKNSEKWVTVRMRVTAYCPCPKCCGCYSDGITASGHKIHQGDTFVAADKNYPFETEMIIPGYNSGKLVKVLDRGGVIRGNRLDVFFNSHQQALQWGVRYLDVKFRQL